MITQVWLFCKRYFKIGLLYNQKLIGSLALVQKRVSFDTLFCLAPPVGLEPTTLRLTAACSTDWAIEEYLCRHRPIFPWRHHQSIFGTDELNCCVRDGNRCTLIAKDTDYATAINGYLLSTTCVVLTYWWPVRDSNPCCRRERPES